MMKLYTLIIFEGKNLIINTDEMIEHVEDGPRMLSMCAM